MATAAPVAGIVLAAGAASRMGPNKMLLTLDDEPLVHRVARRALAAGLAPVVVVVGHEADQVRDALRDLPVRTVVNPDPTGPRATSVHVGLAAVPDTAAGALVLLADMVFVTEAMLAAMVAAFRDTGAGAVASRCEGVVLPPFLFSTALFAELHAATGDAIGRATVERHRDRTVFMDWPARALADVDTPEDYAAARRRPPTPRDPKDRPAGSE